MEIGFYNAKYPFRTVINFLLPFCKNMNPNNVSLTLIPLGLITALNYYFASEYAWLYLFGIVLIFIRMVIGTLDGMIAENFNKQTPNGSILNRVTPEVADLLLLPAIILANIDLLQLGIFALVIGWGVSYLGLVGLVGGKKVVSVGPVGQTDRLVALILFSLCEFLSLPFHWHINFIKLFFWWLIIGGIITLVLRCYQVLSRAD